jgi:hypothetical protein
MSDTCETEYTLDDTIEELNNWRQGGRMFPIEVAISAVHWLEKAPGSIDPGKTEPSLEKTIERLKEWLGNTEPKLPDDLALSTFYWLRRVKAAS